MRRGMNPAPRVLIVKTSSMGDVIHALPVASDIARATPEAQIDWIVEEAFAELPRLHPAVKRVLPVALRRWRKRAWSLSSWREFFAARAAVRAHSYDRIVDCQGLLKSAWVARWASGPLYGPDAASAREPSAARLYDHRLSIDRGLHAIERNRQLAAQALGYRIDGKPQFGLRVERDGVLDLAVLITNASRASKLWPDDRWRAIEADLAGRGLRSVLYWGSNGEHTATRARAESMSNAAVAPRSALSEIALALARARIVIGLDTGLTHLAAAVGAPTVGIFCDYEPRLVGVIGDGSGVSLGGTDGGPVASEVIDAIARMLG